MSEAPQKRPNEQQHGQQATRRFYLMNAVRIAGIIVLMLGIAVSRGVIEGYSPVVGYVLSVAGMLGFFFGPYWLVRHWKKQGGGGGNQ